MLTKMKHEQSVFNKLHKFSAKEEPMEVEFSALSDIKGYQSTIQTARDKASNQLNSAIDAISAAKKVADKAVADARKAQAMAKELGVDEGQFNGWEKQFVSNRDTFESAISAIQRIQNNL
jgi:predicted  nucleic acid-binding Zn-ribbon protein